MEWKNKKQPSFFASILLLVLVAFIMVYGIMIAGLKTEFILISAGTIVTLFAILHGQKWDSIMEIMSQKIKTAVLAILILYSIGLIIGTWMISGTIPYFIYFGLEIINPQYLYILAFLATAVVSTCTGTSFGSAGTIGVAIMGIAGAMDVNLAITAGAVISGAYFGDKLSPLSDTTNMSSLIAEVDLYQHIKHLMFTSVPSMLTAALVFFLVGLNIDATEIMDANVSGVSSTIEQIFNWNPILFLPAIIIIAGSVMKKPTVVVLFLSSFTAMLIALFVQQVSFPLVIQAAIEGFNVEMMLSALPNLEISSDLQTLLNRGGIYSMHGTILFVFCAFFFASALEASQVFNVVFSRVFSYIKTATNTILVSLISGLAIILATGNSYITFFLMKEIFSEQYRKQSLHQLNLSRSMEDGGMIPEALVPWTLAGVYMATTLGVSVFDYAPWALFNMLGIVFSAILAIIGPYTNWFGIKREKISQENNSKHFPEKRITG
ncbi:Na+/H+ antiporter NhaC [Cytobacillus firmus]|uniref:Na+/H+ antiporter NhaC n=1 Tax=Cytobacillus firmus TaxID=1399 RepID=UPI001C8DA1E4|nr:Na+/H+ antiporter NhaC [Cytobacillus firmus]MBX9975858.1 Na+/H+ antiporter NhaC [Cytobacillus firmus]